MKNQKTKNFKHFGSNSQRFFDGYLIKLHQRILKVVKQEDAGARAGRGGRGGGHFDYQLDFYND